MATAQEVHLNAIKEEIGKRYGALINGYQKGDWKVTSQIYGPNCVIMPPGKPTIKGRDNAEKYWRQLKEETGVTKIEIQCDEINGSGDFVYERGAYILHKKEGPFEKRTLQVWYSILHGRQSSIQEWHLAHIFGMICQLQWWSIWPLWYRGSQRRFRTPPIWTDISEGPGHAALF